MYRGSKVIPHHAKSRPSSLRPAHSHDVVFQSEGGIPYTCTTCYSLGTELTERRTVRDATGISAIRGIPFKGSSPLKYSK